MASSADYITTQGAQQYTRADDRNAAKCSKKARKQSSQSAQNTKKSMIAISSIDDAGICKIKYESIDPKKVASYELARGDRGAFKYVQRTADGRFFDVSYYNAELGKSVPLGRFVDECTASLAHALARSDLTCRTVDMAAQQLIERLFVTNAVTEELNVDDPLPSKNFGSGNADDELDSMGLDYDTLFEMVADSGN